MMTLNGKSLKIILILSEYFLFYNFWTHHAVHSFAHVSCAIYTHTWELNNQSSKQERRRHFDICLALCSNINYHVISTNLKFIRQNIIVYNVFYHHIIMLTIKKCKVYLDAAKIDNILVPLFYFLTWISHGKNIRNVRIFNILLDKLLLIVLYVVQRYSCEYLIQKIVWKKGANHRFPDSPRFPTYKN